MRLLSLTKAAIIGVLLVPMLLMAACSAVRLGYSNGPTLAWWWLDGYVDFSREQSGRARQAIDRWFEWHRSTQLVGYANLLAAAGAEVLQPTTAAGACRWQRAGRDALEPALEHALQEAADLVPTLGEAQWQHLETQFAKNNAELRKDFLQSDPDERAQASVKRVLERAEMLYGKLDGAQRKAIAAAVAASPFDPVAWVAERERRQRETVQTLRRLTAQRADRDAVLAALRVLADRAERSPDPTYRAYQLRLVDYNCAFAAQLHNGTTAAQRLAARERLKGWEDDLRSLAAGLPQPPPT